MITIPSFPSGVQQAISSINLLSKTGIKHGGDIRVAEIKNLWANMDRRPYSYVVGMGVGTKWQEIEEQPLDSFTYPEEYVWSSKGWFPQFHLPYLALIYRFGILGFAALLGWIIFYIIQKSRRIPSLADPFHKAMALSILVFLLISLTNIGDSANPTSTIMAGICIGLLDRLIGFVTE